MLTKERSKVNILPTANVFQATNSIELWKICWKSNLMHMKLTRIHHIETWSQQNSTIIATNCCLPCFSGFKLEYDISKYNRHFKIAKYLAIITNLKSLESSFGWKSRYSNKLIPFRCNLAVYSEGKRRNHLFEKFFFSIFPKLCIK